MRRRIVWIVAAALLLVVAWIAISRYRAHVAYREKARFWELEQNDHRKADEDAELEALRRRVGEREADSPGQPPH